MKFSVGNAKLGTNCYVVSRPVGDTCPATCEYLGNGCYAEQSEKMYPGVRPAGFKNLVTDRNKIRAMMIDASKSGKSIRLQERGDWFKDGEVDVEYIDNVVWACESLIRDGIELPKMWFYTHIYDSRIAALGRFMAAYASVHTVEQLRLAKSLGFKRFAWCDSEENYGTKRPNRKEKRAAWKDSLPKLTVIDGEQFTTCPEIRKGREFVTCTGDKNSVACRLCLNTQNRNVMFPHH